MIAKTQVDVNYQLIHTRSTELLAAFDNKIEVANDWLMQVLCAATETDEMEKFSRLDQMQMVEICRMLINLLSATTALGGSDARVVREKKKFVLHFASTYKMSDVIDSILILLEAAMVSKTSLVAWEDEDRLKAVRICRLLIRVLMEIPNIDYWDVEEMV